MSSPSLALHEPVTDARAGYWLFSAPVDLAAFLGSALAALGLLWLGAAWGLLHSDAPDWTWIAAVLLIDVAHVYATNYKVYFDSEELRRRPFLYALVPLLGYALGVALYSEGALAFWRALAYLAVFHFVRQQYGWVVLYRARLNETGRVGFWIDTVAIYAATIYPLFYWHAHLPRQFSWFIPNDFAALPALVESVARPVYWLALGLYLARAFYRGFIARRFNPGKDIVVVTTALCWHVGIVTFNSDYAFTVTNVIIHGVPYLALVYWHAQRRRAAAPTVYRWLARNFGVFLLALWMLAFVEEFFWDKTVWHERGWLFGAGWQADAWKMWLAPLLALPQLTHYFLDGFIWRRRSNPEMNELTGPVTA
jgi:hypothetical protein